MMKDWKFLLLCWGGAIMLLFAGCTVPQRIWPQKDLQSSETLGTMKGPVVLVASRSSEFKKDLVRKLHEELASAGMTQKTVGVEDLKTINAADYDAVVVISTCIAWGLDHDVKTFLDRQEKHHNIILVTTSGDGGWLPEKDGREFDAISSASKMTNVDAVARNVIASINTRLQGVEDTSLP